MSYIAVLPGDGIGPEVIEEALKIIKSIESISGNKLTVERGKDGTTIKAHLKGDPVKGITDADDALIETGDDFGFDGSVEGFV